MCPGMNWFEFHDDEPDTIGLQMLGRERYILTPQEAVELAQALMIEAARFSGGILDLAPRVTRIDLGGRIYNVKFPGKQQVALTREGLVAVRDLINEALAGADSRPTRRPPEAVAEPSAAVGSGSSTGS